MAVELNPSCSRESVAAEFGTNVLGLGTSTWEIFGATTHRTLRSLSLYGTAEHPVYAAIWDDNESLQRILFEETAQFTQQTIVEQALHGFAPVAITAVGGDLVEPAYFTTIFEPRALGERGSFVAQPPSLAFAIDLTSFVSESTITKASTLFPICIDSYIIGGSNPLGGDGTLSYCAIWDSQPAGSRIAWGVSTAFSQFGESFEESDESLAMMRGHNRPHIVVPGRTRDLWGTVITSGGVALWRGDTYVPWPDLAEAPAFAGGVRVLGPADLTEVFNFLAASPDLDPLHVRVSGASSLDARFCVTFVPRGMRAALPRRGFVVNAGQLAPAVMPCQPTYHTTNASYPKGELDGTAQADPSGAIDFDESFLVNNSSAVPHEPIGPRAIGRTSHTKPVFQPSTSRNPLPPGLGPSVSSRSWRTEGGARINAQDGRFAAAVPDSKPLKEVRRPGERVTVRDSTNTGDKTKKPVEQDPFDSWMFSRMGGLGARGGQLAIARAGRLVVSRAYTLAECGYPIVRLDHLFRLHSISKALTSMGVLGSKPPDVFEATNYAPTQTIASAFNLQPSPGNGVLFQTTLDDLMALHSGWAREDSDPFNKSYMALVAAISRGEAIPNSPLLPVPGDLRAYLANTDRDLRDPAIIPGASPSRYQGNEFRALAELVAWAQTGDWSAKEAGMRKFWNIDSSLASAESVNQVDAHANREFIVHNEVLQANFGEDNSQQPSYVPLTYGRRGSWSIGAGRWVMSATTLARILQGMSPNLVHGTHLLDTAAVRSIPRRPPADSSDGGLGRGFFFFNSSYVGKDTTTLWFDGLEPGGTAVFGHIVPRVRSGKQGPYHVGDSLSIAVLLNQDTVGGNNLSWPDVQALSILAGTQESTFGWPEVDLFAIL